MVLWLKLDIVNNLRAKKMCIWVEAGICSHYKKAYLKTQADLDDSERGLDAKTTPWIIAVK